MKKILLILMLVITFKGYSQMVVSDPGNLGVNIAIQSLSELSNNLSTFMAQAEKLKLAVDVFQQISAIAEITQYIDQLSCLMSELQFNLAYANNYSCLTELNFGGVNLTLRYVSDIIMKVFLTKNLITMTQGERIKSLNDILVILKKLVEEVSVMNASVRSYAKRRMVHNYIKSHVYSPKIGFFTNRYDRKK